MFEETVAVETPAAEEQSRESATAIDALAASLRVKARRAEDGELITFRKLCHIYQHDLEGRVFGLSLDNPADVPRLDNPLGARKSKAPAAPTPEPGACHQRALVLVPDYELTRDPLAILKKRPM